MVVTRPAHKDSFGYCFTPENTKAYLGRLIILYVLTSANQLMVMEFNIWSLSNPDFELGTFPSLAKRAYQLTNCANRAHKKKENGHDAPVASLNSLVSGCDTF
jgi:hypothetical protein